MDPIRQSRHPRPHRHSDPAHPFGYSCHPNFTFSNRNRLELNPTQSAHKPVMKTSDFNSYKSRYRNAIRQVLAQAEPGRLDEAAFPAYSHRNPVINWLFWQRLRKVMEHIQRPTLYERVLDFGCGSGVMLPYISQISSQLNAMECVFF